MKQYAHYFATKHMKLIVWAIDFQYKSLNKKVRKITGLSHDDLFQECVLRVLSQAIPKWIEDDRDYKISTFICNGVKWQLMKLLSDFESDKGQFETQLGTDHLKQSFGMELEYYRVDDVCSDFDLLEEVSRNQRDVWNTVKQFLNKQQQKAIDLRFFQGMSLSEASEVMEVTRERVRQVEALALRKIQNAIDEPENIRTLNYLNAVLDDMGLTKVAAIQRYFFR